MSESNTNWTIWGVFLLFGVTSLLGWNTWINAGPFYRQRLLGSPYYDVFQGWFAATYMWSNLAGLSLLLLAHRLITPRMRVVLGFSLSAAIFGASGVLVTAGASLSAEVYFKITLIMVALSAFASSLSFGIIGLVSEFSPICAQAISTGQGFAGLIPAVMALVLVYGKQGNVHTLSQESDNAARSFYTSLAISLVSLVAYYMLPHNTKTVSGSQEYQSVPRASTPILEDRSRPGYNTAAAANNEGAVLDTEEESLNPKQPTILEVLADVWDVALAVFLNFVLTLALYPAITAAVESIHKDGPLADKNLFVAVGFVVYNIWDVIGKAMPGYKQFYIRSNKPLLWAAISRFIWIPLLLLCNVTLFNKQGQPLARYFPTVFGDAMFFVILSLFSVSGAWIGSNVVMWGPESVPKAKSVLAGDIVIFCLTLGLAVGSGMTFFVREMA